MDNLNIPIDGYSTAEIEHSLKVLLATPELLNKLIQEKERSRTRRKNWSRLSRSSYYNKRYALELKALVDDMLSRGVDKEFRFEDYQELKPTTIYLRVNHSKLYLLDELDPQEYYKEQFQRIHISKEKTGIRLTLLKEHLAELKAVDISLDEKQSNWQSKIDEYLEVAKPGHKPLHLKGLSLTAEEVDILKQSFLPLEHVGAIITATEIMVRLFEEKK